MISSENTPVKVGILQLLYLSQGSQYVIPAYQRNYTWTANKEVRQLLEDLKEVLRGTYSKHFIGIMIYLEKAINAFTRERSIIDGQQRLTTIFLMLYAIKELLIENGFDSEAEQLDNNYLLNIANKDIKFKLKPLVADDEVYRKIVNRDFSSITESNSNVYKNFLYIKKYISDLMASYTLTGDILTAIDKLYIVCVPISTDDYPQKIFESINATGAKLTASDLIRNFILMPINSAKQDEYYSKYWKKIETVVSSDAKKLEAFFRFFIMAKNRSVVNKSAVYYAFTDWYRKNESTMSVEEIFQEIVDYAVCYNKLYICPIKELPSELKGPISEFRMILSDMPAPLLMELYKIHMSGSNLSLHDFASTIEILNSYLMRRALAGLDTSDISRYFPTLLKDVLTECNCDYKEIVEVFKKNLINRNRGNSQQMPDDKTMRDRILNANMYNLRTWLQIFLQKLELQDNPAPVDFSKLSIEHLMPQTPTAEWFSELKVSREDYERNIHRLGNLTFAARPDNSKMGNKVWEYKNKVLSNTSHLKINEDILKKDHWTIQEIDTRTEFLISKICTLYPYYSSQNPDISGVPIYINMSDAYAIGTFYPEIGSVEIAQGSIITSSFPNADQYPEVEALRIKLLDEGILLLNNNNAIEFKESYTLYPKRNGATALSASANLILHGSRNGWEYWCLEDGTVLRDSTYGQQKLN